MDFHLRIAFVWEKINLGYFSESIWPPRTWCFPDQCFPLYYVPSDFHLQDLGLASEARTQCTSAVFRK